MPILELALSAKNRKTRSAEWSMLEWQTNLSAGACASFILLRFSVGVFMNKYTLHHCRFLLLSLMVLGSVPTLANSGGKGPAEGVNYIAINPPLVVNYGGPGKTRFIKAELSLRAENAADATEILHHLPLIRDKLITILSAQTEEVISTPEGKEGLRLHALAEINKALHIVEYGAEEPAATEEPTTDKSKKDDKTKKTEKDKKADKDKKEDKSKKDKKTDKDHKKEAQESDAEATHAEHVGPASDLLFNNFVVQK